MNRFLNENTRVRERFYPKSGRVYRPVQILPVNDRAEQISYCVKSYWPKKVRYVDDQGGKRTAHCRLDEPHHIDWLLWRDQFVFMDFVFLHGLRRYGGKVQRIAPAET